jgi:molybdopterin synthase catalytic subunit
MFAVTTDPLDPQALVNAVQSDEDGAVCLFYGVVRNNNLGRRVLYLEYDAYAPMALKVMREIAEDVKRRFPVSAAGALHRTGRLEIGETSLLVAVASPHRAEAFAACHYMVDRIKELVPVWKKEVFEGGEEWIEGNIPDIEAARFDEAAATTEAHEPA